MKYKLKRDHPLGNAGTELIANEPLTLKIFDDTDRDFQVFMLWNSKYGMREILIPVNYLSEWVEKIEPREWEIGVLGDSLITQDNAYWLQMTSAKNDVKIIKVREVLE